MARYEDERTPEVRQAEREARARARVDRASSEEEAARLRAEAEAAIARGEEPPPPPPKPPRPRRGLLPWLEERRGKPLLTKRPRLPTRPRPAQQRQGSRSSTPRPPGARRPPDVYAIRRRRAVAIAVIGVLGILGFVVLVGGGGAEHLSKGEQLRAERAENPVEMTLSFSGDLLIHSPLWNQALANGGGSSYDFVPMLEPIRPYVEKADLAFCHIETPLGEGEPQTEPLFRAPAELADAVAAIGWDVCDTASNHTLDQHQEGIEETLTILDGAGIAHTGSFATEADSETPLVIEAKGVKIGFVAYTDFTNDIPPEEPWSVNFAETTSDTADIIADAKAAWKAGAEAVIVQMAWGPENGTEPDSDQEEMAQDLTASKYVTAVVGNGPHVVQPIERVNNKLVVYSEGNLLSNQDVNCCPPGAQDGLIAELKLVIDGAGAHVDSIRYVPIWVDHTDYSVLPVGDALKQGVGDPTALQESYDRTTGIAGSEPGVTPEPKSL